jgi:hypothetical protein
MNSIHPLRQYREFTSGSCVEIRMPVRCHCIHEDIKNTVTKNVLASVIDLLGGAQ